MSSIITYEQLKNYYNEFKKNPPKDAYDRYASELRQVRNLIETAKLNGLEKDVFEYQKTEKAVIDKLTQMGYTVQQ